MKRGLVILVCAFVLVVPLVYGSIDVMPNFKNVYNIGEVVDIDFTFTSDENVTMKFFSFVSCPDLFKTNRDIKVVELAENTPYDFSYNYTTITDSDITQDCKVFLRINEPFDETSEYDISIIAKEEIPIEFSLCEERGCEDIKGIFYLGDDVHLGYESGIADVDVDAVLKMPSGSSSAISLPSSIGLEETGSYEADITAKKEGHTTSYRSIQFTVIDKPVKIDVIQECNSNLICDNNEDYGSCPSDCKAGSRDDYCDGLSDGICDPDCTFEQDKDCPEVLPEEEEELIEIPEGVEEEIDVAEEEPLQKEIEPIKPKKSNKGLLIVIGCIIALILLVLIKLKRPRQPEIQ